MSYDLGDRGGESRIERLGRGVIVVEPQQVPRPGQRPRVARENVVFAHLHQPHLAF
jgi:hypothetical protein